MIGSSFHISYGMSNYFGNKTLLNNLVNNKKTYIFSIVGFVIVSLMIATFQIYFQNYDLSKSVLIFYILISPYHGIFQKFGVNQLFHQVDCTQRTRLKNIERKLAWNAFIFSFLIQLYILRILPEFNIYLSELLKITVISFVILGIIFYRESQSNTEYSKNSIFGYLVSMVSSMSVFSAIFDLFIHWIDHANVNQSIRRSDFVRNTAMKAFFICFTVVGSIYILNYVKYLPSAGLFFDVFPLFVFSGSFIHLVGDKLAYRGLRNSC